MKILYLDYDGVFHPSAVYVGSKGPYLDPTFTQLGMSMFMWCDKLAQALVDFPDVKIVLSTSWVSAKGFGYAKEQLTKELQDKVVGATFHSNMKKDVYDNSFGMLTRYQQIIQDIPRRLPTHWVAIDDDYEGWPDIAYDHFIRTDSVVGLGDDEKIVELRRILSSWT